MEIAFTDFVQPDLELERTTADSFGLTVREPETHCQSAEDLLLFARGAGAIVTQQAPVTRKVMQGLPELRIVSLPQVGTDAVDLEAARDLGIWVCNVPDANATEVAAHAAAMALSLVRGLPHFDASVRGGRWDYLAAGPLRRPGILTAGVVGFGRIGRLFARNVQPVFGRVIAYDAVAPDAGWPETVARMAGLDDLLAEADVVSLHVPLTAATQGLFDAARLARMRPGSILVNVSRGPVVVVDALCDALDRGTLACAGLDVLPQEPPGPAARVLRHPKVLLSPHAAFYSVQSDEETRRRSVETVAALVRDGRPNDVVVEGTR